jgi:hypothetical protein
MCPRPPHTLLTADLPHPFVDYPGPSESPGRPGPSVKLARVQQGNHEVNLVAQSWRGRGAPARGWTLLLRHDHGLGSLTCPVSIPELRADSLTMRLSSHLFHEPDKAGGITAQEHLNADLETLTEMLRNDDLWRVLARLAVRCRYQDAIGDLQYTEPRIFTAPELTALYTSNARLKRERLELRITQSLTRFDILRHPDIRAARLALELLDSDPELGAAQALHAACSALD